MLVLCCSRFLVWSEPNDEHSRKASKACPRDSFGKPFVTISLCRQLIALPAILGLRVLQASRNGRTKSGRHFKSLSRSVYITDQDRENGPAAS